MSDSRNTLIRFAEGVWLASEPVAIVGMQLTATMAVLRLADQSLLLYSPVSLTPELRAAVEPLGSVEHLYAPNTFHHLHIAEWAEAFPDSKLHAPAGLSRKRPDLKIDRAHTARPEPAFEGCIDEIAIGGFRLEESVLFHRPSRVLLVADLVHNVGQPQQPWARFYTRAMGFYDRVALSRIIRWTGFSDRSAARESVDRVLALPFGSVVVGHGSPIVKDAKESLTQAVRWLGISA